MKIKFFLILTLTFAFITISYDNATGHENGIDPTVFEEVDSICQGIVDNDNTPGAVLLIGRCFDNKPDVILYQSAYGKRNETEDATLDTLYDLASVTKPTFTTVSV